MHLQIFSCFVSDYFMNLFASLEALIISQESFVCGCQFQFMLVKTLAFYLCQLFVANVFVTDVRVEGEHIMWALIAEFPIAR